MARSATALDAGATGSAFTVEPAAAALEVGHGEADGLAAAPPAAAADADGVAHEPSAD
jgi:hypothetical protein